MKIEFLPKAQQELVEAVEFYEKQLDGLGVLFYEEVSEALDLIRLFPEGWQMITRLTRKYCLHKFPYMILYGIINDVIVISSIAHQRRRPKSYLR